MFTIDVIADGCAHLLTGAQEDIVEFTIMITLADLYRPAAAAPFAFAALPGFQALEVGQDLLP